MAATSSSDDQIMLHMIFLKYITVGELSKILMSSRARTLPPTILANLFILDSRRNINRILDLIREFDSDTFTNQRICMSSRMPGPRMCKRSWTRC